MFQKKILKPDRYSKHLLCLRQSQVFRSEYWTKFWEIWKLNPFRIFFNRMWLFWFYWIFLIHFLTRFLVSFLLRVLKIYFDASIFRLRNENALKNYQRASGLKLFWNKYKKPWNRGVQPKLFMRPWISFFLIKWATICQKLNLGKWSKYRFDIEFWIQFGPQVGL